ncbi:hypothetical protein KSP40_PGU011326 [Platanthera guangdongensis]|uniref:Heptahelical transmembrane protein 4-like n=1 Tax=Platanthera guangdongensis TaxID=2320717 RepID=A0ABR2MFJ0_9ASPA
MCFQVATMASSVCLEIITTSTANEESDTQFLISTGNSKWEKQEKISAIKSNKWELVDYDSLPEFLKHNEFILDHYRSEWPLKQTICSVFSLHNETLNIWTHLIGFFIFLILTTHAASIFTVAASNPSSSPQSHSGNSSNILTPLSSPTNNSSTLVAASPPEQLLISRWPFYLYLSGVMFCLLMSSACHLLCCHSAATCYLTLRLDYAGISALIVSSFYPLVYYTFYCLPFFRNLYLCSITLFGAAAIAATLSPAFESPRFRAARSVLFACMGASGLVPIAHKMVAFGDRPEAVLSTGYEVLMGVFYGIGVVVYSARIPERWLPGKFDIAGHSHQLFHVLVIAGAYTHYLASVVYLEWREAEGC